MILLKHIFFKKSLTPWFQNNWYQGMKPWYRLALRLRPWRERSSTRRNGTKYDKIWWKWVKIWRNFMKINDVGLKNMILVWKNDFRNQKTCFYYDFVYTNWKLEKKCWKKKIFFFKTLFLTRNLIPMVLGPKNHQNEEKLRKTKTKNYKIP